MVTGNKRGNVNLLRRTGFEPYEDIVAHLGAVTRIRASYDGRFVFSAGEDGTIFVYEVSEATELAAQSDLEAKEEVPVIQVDEQLADIVLIKKTELDEFKAA